MLCRKSRFAGEHQPRFIDIIFWVPGPSRSPPKAKLLGRENYIFAGPTPLTDLHFTFKRTSEDDAHHYFLQTRSMMKEPRSGEYHDHIMLIYCCFDLSIPDRTSRMHDIPCPKERSAVNIIPEWKEPIRCENKPFPLF